jgi:hypothetical protein
VRLYLRSQDRRPDPPPLPTNDRATVLAGMGVWAALWVAALAFHGRLAAAGSGWWIWTPPAGLALGVLGLWYLERREQRLRRDQGGDPPLRPTPEPNPDRNPEPRA